MNNMAYLQQISASAKNSSPKPPRTGFLGFITSPKFLIISGVAVFVIIFFMIISSLVTSFAAREQRLTEQLYLRLSNLSESLDKYTDDVKSSSLRTIGRSFSSAISNTQHDLEPILKDRFKIKTSQIPKNLQKSETEFITTLNENLSDAKLNDLLDHVYKREFTLQIALALSIESEILARTKHQPLKTALQSSTYNLSQIQKQFDNYVSKTN